MGVPSSSPPRPHKYQLAVIMGALPAQGGVLGPQPQGAPKSHPNPLHFPPFLPPPSRGGFGGFHREPFLWGGGGAGSP